jgi:simple sugar transport system ATP-binding protein
VELDEIMSLSDRIAVMFDGRIMGERRPDETSAGELGLLMAGITDGPPDGARARRGLSMDRMPRWADVLLIPTISLVLAALISGW